MSMQSERKKAVTLAASVACMAAPCAVFAQKFPRFVWVWIALMIGMLVLVGKQFAKLKGKSDE